MAGETNEGARRFLKTLREVTNGFKNRFAAKPKFEPLFTEAEIAEMQAEQDKKEQAFLHPDKPTIEYLPTEQAIAKPGWFSLVSPESQSPYQRLEPGNESNGILEAAPDGTLLVPKGTPFEFLDEEGYRILRKTPQGWVDIRRTGQIALFEKKRHDQPLNNPELAKRCETLRRLDWPILTWHGTTQDRWEGIQKNGKHDIFSSVTFSTDKYLASGDQYMGGGGIMLGYLFPANTYLETPTISGPKGYLSFSKGNRPPFVDESKESDAQYAIDVKQSIDYPYSKELIIYLKSLGIKISDDQITHNKDDQPIIRLPILFCLARNGTTDEEFDYFTPDLTNSPPAPDQPISPVLDLVSDTAFGHEITLTTKDDTTYKFFDIPQIIIPEAETTNS